ncbi:unnamed protein product [Lathyrus oleraceus]|uniref:HECT-type E3 ubiquitin transferase n=1 Tax=Pisum sativum TaxID=3888 RepID=A0A9D4X4A9_PEA|nr:E3 ubiquitin-protein ligase UPL5-like isoform X1 [Pisum sativum]KAI5414493.1 hypothetical protein KIW84_040114 [Pisum sativum]
MTPIETPIQQQRLSSKRKLDDDDESVLDDDLVYVRMRKEETTETTVKPWSGGGCRGGGGSGDGLLKNRGPVCFFIRMVSEGYSVVMNAFPENTVQSIHERIYEMKRIPLFEQRLIFKGKQLQWEQTLAECGIQKDVILELVGRMRSTEHPQAWQVVNDMVTIAYDLCLGENVQDPVKTVKNLLTTYINLALAPKPKLDSDSATKYFQIFTNCSAISILVTLYVSPFTGNKSCSDTCIRHFLNCCKTTLSETFHTQAARVALEFCKLLRRVGIHDPLYLYCRNCLGFFLEASDITLASSEDQNDKGSVLVQDLFPFVRELADSLLMDLDMSIDTPSFACPVTSNVGDFAAFLVPVRNGIKQQKSNRGFVPYHKLGRNSLVLKEIEYLFLLYDQLLCKIEICLQKMDKRFVNKEMSHEENYFHPACSLYLSVLKELHKISKLYDGASEKLQGVLTRQKAVLCQLLVKYAKRSDEHQWILEHKNVTNFEARRHLAMMMFPEVKEDYEELHEMLIDRSQLLTESFEYVARAEPESLRAGLFMEFKNEEATGPGVLREWFLLVCQAIFNQENALFVSCPNDQTRFLPNSASKVHPLHLEYFSFCGRVIALALMHGVQVGIVFDRVFFLQLAGKSICVEDIRDADPELYRSCKQILDMDSDLVDSDALGLTFVREVDELGHRKAIELCPGGKDVVVTSKNRAKYIYLLIQNRFVTSIAQQVSHFAKGFADILSSTNLQTSFFQGLDPEDLDWMLRGCKDAISVEDWKKHTEYNGYKETDIQISWFWEIVGKMTAEEKKILLFFWTSVKYLPVEGFCGLGTHLYIYKSHEPGDHLPSSHTCFYRLCFPAYSSMPAMQARLKVITQEHIGSSFGTW